MMIYLGQCDETGKHSGLDIKKLSTQSERVEVKCVKVGEALTGNTEPSLRNQEGVETRRRKPKASAMVKV